VSIRSTASPCAPSSALSIAALAGAETAPIMRLARSRLVKGFGVALILGLAGLGLAGCGSDGGTTYVLQSESPSAGSPSVSASASTDGSPASSSLPATAATPIPNNFKIIIDSPDGGTVISSPVDVAGTASVDKGPEVAVVLQSSSAQPRAA